jgi:SAM-dependent methyltransferase
VYDLGCGDGRIVIMAAQKFGARGTGIDINPVRIKEAEENARAAGVEKRVRFIEKNLFEADVHEATLVTLYLLPDVNRRLRPLLLRQLKAGTRIVSHAFDMDDWVPDQKINADGRTLYLWNVTEKTKREFGGTGGGPGAVDGEWVYKMPTPNGELEAKLILKTQGSTLSGTFFFPEDRKLEISEGTVEGNQLKFTVRRDRQGGGVMIYKMGGTVDGDQIKGTAETEMDGQPAKSEWNAKRK